MILVIGEVLIGWDIDKVRLLYDRGQPTARLVVRSRKDLDTPLVCWFRCDHGHCLFDR